MMTVHQSVMEQEVIEMMSPRKNELYVDATFGGGGHSRALLQAAPCSVQGFDRDEAIIKAGHYWVSSFAPRLKLTHALWSEIKPHLKKEGIDKVDGLLVDCGVSSMQLDDAMRGFSFQQNAPLDMRMGKSSHKAFDVVNDMSQAELERILRDYGDEPRAKVIARAIVEARRRKPITHTVQLAELTGKRHGRQHPATRTFLALRLYINDELGQLTQLLEDATSFLSMGGRLVTLTFHGKEDEIVKKFLNRHAPTQKQISKPLPFEEPISHVPASYQLLNRHVIKPSRQEIEGNPRARSARLRAAIRIKETA